MMPGSAPLRAQAGCQACPTCGSAGSPCSAACAQCDQCAQLRTFASSTCAIAGKDLRAACRPLVRLLNQAQPPHRCTSVLQLAEVAALVVFRCKSGGAEELPGEVCAAVASFWKRATALSLGDADAQALALQARVFYASPDGGIGCPGELASAAGECQLASPLVRLGINRAGMSSQARRACLGALACVSHRLVRGPCTAWLGAAAAAISDRGWRTLVGMLSSPADSGAACLLCTVRAVVTAADVRRLDEIAGHLVCPAVLRQLADNLEATRDMEGDDADDGCLPLVRLGHVLLVIAPQGTHGTAGRRRGGPGAPALPGDSDGGSRAEGGASQTGGVSQAFEQLAGSLGSLASRLQWRAREAYGKFTYLNQASPGRDRLGYLQVVDAVLNDRAAWYAVLPTGIPPPPHKPTPQQLLPSAALCLEEMSMLRKRIQRMPKAAAGDGPSQHSDHAPVPASPAADMAEVDRLLAELDVTEQERDGSGTDRPQSKRKGRKAGAGLPAAHGGSSAGAAPSAASAAAAATALPEHSSPLSAASTAQLPTPALTLQQRPSATAEGFVPVSTSVSATCSPTPRYLELPCVLCCPITQALLVDPVATADGHVYSRAAIEAWLSRGEGTSPMTGQMLPTPVVLTPSHRLDDLVRAWAVQQGLSAAHATPLRALSAGEASGDRRSSQSR